MHQKPKFANFQVNYGYMFSCRGLMPVIQYVNSKGFKFGLVRTSALCSFSEINQQLWSHSTQMPGCTLAALEAGITRSLVAMVTTSRMQTPTHSGGWNVSVSIQVGCVCAKLLVSFPGSQFSLYYSAVTECMNVLDY